MTPLVLSVTQLPGKREVTVFSNGRQDVKQAVPKFFEKDNQYPMLAELMLIEKDEGNRVYVPWDEIEAHIRLAA